MNLDVPKAEIEARLKKWKAPAAKYTRGVLAKYARYDASGFAVDTEKLWLQVEFAF